MTYAVPLFAGLFVIVIVIVACIRRLTLTQWLWRSVMDDRFRLFVGSVAGSLLLSVTVTGDAVIIAVEMW